MRRNRRRNGDVMIDLTSLLDVIFIVLLIVLCYASSLGDNTIKKQQELDAKQEELDNACKAYEKMVTEANSLTQFVGIIVISIPPDKTNYHNRQIIVLENGEQKREPYDLVGNNTNAQFESLRADIEKYIDDHAERPVIISLNDQDGEILYRDEKVVNAMIDELKSTYDNIYVK